MDKLPYKNDELLKDDEVPELDFPGDLRSHGFPPVANYFSAWAVAHLGRMYRFASLSHAAFPYLQRSFEDLLVSRMEDITQVST